MLHNAFFQGNWPPPPRNANNVERYTFVTLFSGKLTHTHPTALRNTWMAPVLCYLVLSYLVLSYLVLSYLVLSYLVLSYLVLSYLVLSYLVLSYLVLSYLVLSYLVLSYLVLSYLVLSYPSNKPCASGYLTTSKIAVRKESKRLSRRNIALAVPDVFWTNRGDKGSSGRRFELNISRLEIALILNELRSVPSCSCRLIPSKKTQPVMTPVVWNR